MKLSTREYDVLTLIALGFSDKEMAVELKISERTIQTYIVSIFAKLNARNRANAIFLYMRQHPNWDI